MISMNRLPVTIYAFYEGMRLKLTNLPYEASYEEVIRRCELALGGVRLPPGVWLQCRGCSRRLSLCNNPQRQMPGCCHETDVWEWNVNVPFMAFVSLNADGVSEAVPMRVPSKNQTIADLKDVAARTLELGYQPVLLLFNGELLDEDKTVEQCGIVEGDRLVLLRRWKVTIQKGSPESQEIECELFGCMSLQSLMSMMLDNNLFCSVVEMFTAERSIWREGEDASKTLMAAGLKDGDVLKIKQKPEHEALEMETAFELQRILEHYKRFAVSSTQTDDMGDVLDSDSDAEWTRDSDESDGTLSA